MPINIRWLSLLKDSTKEHLIFVQSFIQNLIIKYLNPLFNEHRNALFRQEKLKIARVPGGCESARRETNEFSRRLAIQQRALSLRRLAGIASWNLTISLSKDGLAHHFKL